MTLGKRSAWFCVMAVCLGLGAAVSTPSSAPAGQITANFQGTVTSVDPGLSPPFSAGQILTGSYTFESTTLPASGSTSTSATFDAVTSLNFSVSGAGYTASSSLLSGGPDQIQIDASLPNPSPPPTLFPDRYAVVSQPSPLGGLTGAAVNGNPLSLFTIVLLDSTNTAFTDATILPTSVSLSSFTSANFSLDFGSLAAPLIVSGTVDSVSFVPEPTTFAMLLGAVGIGLGWLWRKRAA